MTELANLSEGAFLASVVHDDKDIVIRLAGNADAAAQKELDRLFGEVHEQAGQLGVSRVHVDMRELNFMSSSCIKDVIMWLEKIRKADEAKRYLVTFLSSKAQPWQRRSLQALTHFAREIISVEVC
jgi:hypothetical protein